MLSQNRLTFKYGFTLIELLVVVAIFGILVSILMPSLQKARRKGVQAVCLSNETQQYKAYFMFATDNKDNLPIYNDGYPPNFFHKGATKSIENQAMLLKDYTSTFAIWNCSVYGNITTIDDSANKRSMNYVAYSYYAGRREPNFGEGVSSADNFLDENADSSHVLLQDNLRDHRSMGLGIFTNHSPSAVVPLSSNPTYLHKRPQLINQLYGANILFYDGHAKWVNGKSLRDVGPDSTGSPVRTLSVFP